MASRVLLYLVSSFMLISTGACSKPWPAEQKRSELIQEWSAELQRGGNLAGYQQVFSIDSAGRVVRTEGNAHRKCNVQIPRSVADRILDFRYRIPIEYTPFDKVRYRGISCVDCDVTKLYVRADNERYGFEFAISRHVPGWLVDFIEDLEESAESLCPVKRRDA